MTGTPSVRTGAILTLGLLLSLGGDTRADEKTAVQQPTLRRSIEVLAHMDRPEIQIPRPERTWFTNNIHIKKKRGFEYTHVTSFNGRPLLFNIQGPVMRKKRLGLTLELRF